LEFRRVLFRSALTDSATRSGSCQSIGDGRPVLMSQKPQERVQVSPSMRNVAVPLPQHSPRLGHMASSQTVCSSLLRIRPRSHSYVSPPGARTRIHSGRRRGRGDGLSPEGVWISSRLMTVIRLNLSESRDTEKTALSGER